MVACAFIPSTPGRGRLIFMDLWPVRSTFHSRDLNGQVLCHAGVACPQILGWLLAVLSHRFSERLIKSHSFVCQDGFFFCSNSKTYPVSLYISKLKLNFSKFLRLIFVSFPLITKVMNGHCEKQKKIKK